LILANEQLEAMIGFSK